ncbi:head GIN domain-containing protein [Flavobacterium sp.]|uniref:head GIN domain-containing protein n=1 Tax=Flavobacterium sp. TaxID=239 RepID=UPI002B4AE0F2|nr:head GIN domain-containing protein [Flavobacterium sp.]HLF50986.1 head GIN domain-containing protein [Flavobacterium sp.]
MNYKLIVLLLIAQIGFSQEKITKNLGDFDEIKVLDKISVQLIPSNENRIEISGKNNSDVEIINKNGELKIRMPLDKFLKGDDVTALLYFKKIESVEASEGSYISSEKPFKQIALAINSKTGSHIKLNLEVQKVKIRSASGGIVELEGTAKNQEVIISTGGILKAKDLQTAQTTVTVSTGGNADIRASELVDAKVKAGGVITIFGKPKQINQKTVLGGTIVESNR